MSKLSSPKRLRPITAWLKKELRVEIENLPINLISNSSKQVIQPLKEKNQNQNEESVIAEKPKLRRSARNLTLTEKPIEEPVLKEPAIEDLPEILFNGKIVYINDFYECASVCDKLLTEVENSSDKIVPVGFDLEWPFSFQTGSGKTALAQVCLSENICYLFYLYKFKKLPVSFVLLLSHSKVKLVGVNIKNDVWKLSKDFKDFPGQKVVDDNCLDCGPYANKVTNRSGRWSLERLTAFLLKRRISKDPSVRRSKWNIEPLSKAQKLYAATDAYVSLLLHLTIEQQEVISQIVEEAAVTSVN